MRIAPSEIAATAAMFEDSGAIGEDEHPVVLVIVFGSSVGSVAEMSVQVSPSHSTPVGSPSADAGFTQFGAS